MPAAREAAGTQKSEFDFGEARWVSHFAAPHGEDPLVLFFASLGFLFHDLVFRLGMIELGAANTCRPCSWFDSERDDLLWSDNMHICLCSIVYPCVRSHLHILLMDKPRAQCFYGR